jgi:dihydropteroate synthase
MEYHDALSLLRSLRRFQVHPGTDAVAALLDELDVSPPPAVQIAGANGKGSTAAMVDAVLREAGLRVGRYTSPHLDDPRERVRVDGRPVPRATVTEFAERARPFLRDRAADGDPLTFFEALTALALYRFDRAGCDVCVLEAGMGGRDDATSVVDPVAGAVTSVAVEHAEVLGDLSEIAARQAAVAPADGPLVTGATGEGLAALERTGADLYRVGDEGPLRATATDVDLRGTDVRFAGDADLAARLTLPGAHQARNAGVALALARRAGDALGAEVGAEAARRGLERATVPGRFEATRRGEAWTALDGAHNPAACEAVAETLAAVTYEDLHLVFGATREKDHPGMVAALPTPASVRTCAASVARAADPGVLARLWERGGVDATAESSVVAALRAAEAAAGPDDLVLVVGSLYVVGEARRTWTGTARPVDPRDAADRRAVLRAAGVGGDDRERLADRLGSETVVLRVRSGRAPRVGALAAQTDAVAAVGAGGAAGEPVSVVVSGSPAALGALADLLGAESALTHVAADLRRALDPPAPDPALPWADGTAVMGVLNVTPDSFHDGGEYDAVEDAVARAEAMVAAGADVVDVGGESTRPGADPVSAEAERRRVEPVVEAVAATEALVSVDTRKPAVAAAALDAGADVVNDVTGLADPRMRALVAERGCPVVVMHSLSAPVDPDEDPEYDDAVADVIAALRERLVLAERAGIDRERVVVDPGVGFGKSARESFALMGRLGEFRALGCPVLVGHSHKSLFAAVDRDHGERLPATVAATALLADRGADVVRVHDVPENVAAVRTALETARAGRGRERGPSS